jgi:hypothetical protein
MLLVEPRGQSRRGLWSEDWGFRASMRLTGPEGGGVVAVSRPPGPGLVSVFASGAFPSDAASPSEGGGEDLDGGGKGGYSGP